METTVDEGTAVPVEKKAPRIGLAWQIAIGLTAGVLVGFVLSQYPALRESVISDYLQPAGDLFIKLIKMIVVPIVLTSMIVGIAGVGDGKSLGRIGLRARLEIPRCQRKQARQR
ncbi:cation:dicarboxylate symporter family transporter [Ralstonia pseudosolanacearum]